MKEKTKKTIIVALLLAAAAVTLWLLLRKKLTAEEKAFINSLSVSDDAKIVMREAVDALKRSSSYNATKLASEAAEYGKSVTAWTVQCAVAASAEYVNAMSTTDYQTLMMAS